MEWAPYLPNRLSSLAVLVGTATHVSPSLLPGMKQVVACIADLSAALTGPLGLFDTSALRTRVDPHTAADVLNLLVGHDKKQLDVCLFYFVGHGLLGKGDRLCLALPGSQDTPQSTARTSLPVDDVFDAMKQSTARLRIAILDCCFSGRAFNSPSAADIHLLTATDKIRKALCPEGARHTGFTGALLELLQEGIPDGPEYLDLTAVYRRLAVALPTAAQSCPVPSQRAVGSSGDLAIARNPAYGTARTRQGLASRARFAGLVLSLGLGDLSGRPGRPERRTQAALLYKHIAADATQLFPTIDREVLRYQHAHAVATGEAGDTAEAFRLLEGIVTGWETMTPAPDPWLDDARASRAYWRARMTG